MTLEAPASSESACGLLQDHPERAVAAYDERVDAFGNPRPHWQALDACLHALGEAELRRRAERITLRVRETGIAYDIFSHPSRPTQRWQLDVTPIVISSGEWQRLETALIQRARLLDAILRDLYGSQDLMRSGIVPPELIYADSAYLRPCQGLLPNAGPLRFYAADLARDVDGSWRIIDNHTETLAGIGYAIANRVVHTHVAGDMFKTCNGVRLAQFFQNLQIALAQHAGHERARIALLTPGPHHPDYFSHSYLARYLGYLLVEGQDLRIKGNGLYLKTLEGLKEVDLVVRCVDGRLVDALELDPAGVAGPAGLLRVSRAKPGLVVNAVGSAVAQNRGLGTYLPRLAQHLLGEELLVPDAPRHWLGDPDKRRHVLAHLEDFVVRAAQEGTGRPGQAALGQDARALGPRERELLVQEIHLHSAQLVAEEKRGFSSAPAFVDGAHESKPFAIRCFVAHTGMGYEVMPGGLAMTIDPEATALSARDGHTRDVWVLSSKNQDPHTSLWQPVLETARVDRSQRVIQSRVADDLFWLGRYNERADWTMRVLRSALRRIGEDSGADGALRAPRKCLEALLGFVQTGALRRDPDAQDIEWLCTELVSNPYGTRSLEHTFGSLFRCANLVRDRLSFEAWQTISKFQPQGAFTRGFAEARSIAVLDHVDEGLASLAAFNGLMHENMTRNFGWRFLDMGRRIERAYNLADALRTLFIPPNEPEDEMDSLRLILELADSFITYRSRYRLDPSLPFVLDLLMLDESNPRSIAYQIAAVATHLAALPNGGDSGVLSDDRRLCLSALTSIQVADVQGLAQEAGGRGLDALLSEELRMLPDLSDAIGRHYFNLAEEAQHRVQAVGDARP